MYIYKIINKINGKIYIGKHSSKRKNYWGSGKLIKLAINKYGKENFIKEIIEYCENEIILSQQEKYWIKHYNSQNRMTGYNIADGGEGNSTICQGYWLNKKLTEEHKNNISKNHADFNGQKNPMFGKNHTKKVKEHLKNINLGIKKSNVTKEKHRQNTIGEKNSNAKLNENDVIEIRKKFKNGINYKTLAEEYNVNKPCIWKIINYYTWKHVKI